MDAVSVAARQLVSQNLPDPRALVGHSDVGPLEKMRDPEPGRLLGIIVPHSSC